MIIFGFANGISSKWLYFSDIGQSTNQRWARSTQKRQMNLAQRNARVVKTIANMGV